ncbi:MAG: hypothetical protein COY40_01475 [Alphaproteobacteria bacterium CG_4_10_14_0_8_um_filter_53_9]|nr:MAG: hypothetical protein COY40_01475 [Alphaproteobacteria bacterium CG_4_10_14_0_8_um_filter_53_9]
MAPKKPVIKSKAKTAPAAKANAAPKAAYNKEALHEDYRQTFSLLMKAIIYGIGGVLLYFLIYVVYLGGWAHTPTSDYAAKFLDRYPVDYDGLKTPAFGGPAEPEPAHHE